MDSAPAKRWWRNFRDVGHELELSCNGATHRAYARALAPGDTAYADALDAYSRHRRPPNDRDHRLVVIELSR